MESRELILGTWKFIRKRSQRKSIVICYKSYKNLIQNDTSYTRKEKEITLKFFNNTLLPKRLWG